MKLSNIRIWQKLLLLGIIAAVLCAVPTYLYIRGANKEIRDTLTEIRGLTPAGQLVKLMQPLQVHRDSAAALLSGDRELATLRAMSIACTARLVAGESPVVEASIVKDRGTGFEQELPVVIGDGVVFGGTGDLAVRKLLPALYHRDKDGQLPGDARILAISRKPLTAESFGNFVDEKVAPYLDYYDHHLVMLAGGPAEEDDFPSQAIGPAVGEHQAQHPRVVVHHQVHVPHVDAHMGDLRLGSSVHAHSSAFINSARGEDNGEVTKTPSVAACSIARNLCRHHTSARS